MTVHKSLAALLVLALSACAQLTAEQPLFSVADQGPPPLTEGIWIGVGEGCPERRIRARRFPEDCAPLDIRRTDDGAWRVVFRADLVSDFTASERAQAEQNVGNGPYRLVLAPAVERDVGDGYAPVYVGELTMLRAEGASVSYAVVAPTGVMPATEMRLLASIGCNAILRDGPVEGVSPRYETRTDSQGQDHQELVGCIASSQAAVREAARRAVLESLYEMMERRFVFVRAN